MTNDLDLLLIAHTLRVPAEPAPRGDGTAVARQLDVTLLTAGFKASVALLEHISRMEAGVATQRAQRVVEAVAGLVGDHVRHNVYFQGFPRGVPDTFTFWSECLAEAAGDPDFARRPRRRARRVVVNLLALPRYGRYQHSYAEMAAAHAELAPALGDRVTTLDLGGLADDEARDLYLRLASATTPLREEERDALRGLARHCADGAQPYTIPVRESRAVVNAAQVEAGRTPVDGTVDTVDDVLRLACELAGGDGTLRTPTRFPSFSRARRRLLLGLLDDVVRANPAKLGDVGVRRERWKRLGARLHPGDFPDLAHAARVFAVARRDEHAPSFTSRVEAAFRAGDVYQALRVLEQAPGLLVRSVDRALRSATAPDERQAVVTAVERVLPDVSGRVVLSLREHLGNRDDRALQRIFVNAQARAWSVPDTRARLDPGAVADLVRLCDAETLRRLPRPARLVIDPAIADVALPLSGRSRANGFGTLPRGSRTPVDGDRLRFFVHWRQAARRTDLDLSCLFLDRDFTSPEHASWTNLRGHAFVHSGDLTEAPEGASEQIDVDTGAVAKDVVVPQVLVYSGEGFDDLAEGFFGYMTRDHEQEGLPFEARTVRMKSDLCGTARIVVPVAFVRDGGVWQAVWLHLDQRGRTRFNTVEEGRTTTTVQVRQIVGRRYLTVRHVADLLRAAGTDVAPYTGQELDGPVAFVGFERPDGLPAGSVVYTPANLGELIPA
ncbi:TerD domain [Promicromonospora umidemergens]|uniref:TerD family protein n=1 Tax=Promicromonospora umidemergens TaxID=629679 RepID=A0ABP8WK81_9MICO|nr:TerD family protein [Promicromonospora umidemergens]MCP2283814.1 TerD domain [Promicromonospora umidemergens]